MPEWKFVRELGTETVTSFTKAEGGEWIADEVFIDKDNLKNLVAMVQNGQELADEGWLPAARLFLGLDAPPEPKYPECEKVSAVSDASNQIGTFLDWLPSQGIHLARWQKDDWGEEGMVPNRTPIQELLAKFFEIDQDKLEEEKRAMLGALREANDAKD